MDVYTSFVDTIRYNVQFLEQNAESTEYSQYKYEALLANAAKKRKSNHQFWGTRI